jgi:hypothetical protein
LQREKELVVETLKNASERALTVVKQEYERRMQELQGQCKEDITRIEAMRREAVAKGE